MVFHSFALHWEDITLYDAAGVRSYCLVFVIEIIIGPKKGSDVELENGTKAMVTKLTSITDKIIKCRTNDKSSTEGKCPKSFQSIRGKTIADCLGQEVVVDILRFADRSSFGQLPSWLPLQSGPSPPLQSFPDGGWLQLPASTKSCILASFYDRSTCWGRSYVGGSWWLSNLSGRSCIHSGWGGVGWPAWHSRLPVAT